MNQQVELHGDLWKLDDIADEVEWIRTQKWTRRTYMRESDHEHCVVCCWTIGISDDPVVGEAYTIGGSHWLCLECYTKFIDRA